MWNGSSELHSHIEKLKHKVTDYDDFIDYLVAKTGGNRVELYEDYKNMVRNYDIEYED